MKFKDKLIHGTLIKRYKRFFVDISCKKKIITGHCPNTGSMLGLLKTGNKVWFSKNNDPKRKLKYTLQMIEINKKMVGINTYLTNKIVLEALHKKKIKELLKYNNIKTEVPYSNNTRFDFQLSNKYEKCFLEVKNVTLYRTDSLAEFPDAITSRGKKQLIELINAKRNGCKSFLLFLIQREGCDSFKIAEDIDKEYKIAFNKALKSGVNILCYDCKLNNIEIKLFKKINHVK